MNAPRTRSGKLTYKEYRHAPSDGYRHEVIDGEVYMNPAPSPRHQTVSRRLQFQLYGQIELKGLGLVFDAPIDVELARHDIVQPDIVVLIGPNEKLVTATRIRGVPDLVVEILSPSNRDYDVDLKKKMYQRVRVPEYWVVDPEACRVTQFVLRRGKYVAKRPTRLLRPTVIEGVVVRLEEVW